MSLVDVNLTISKKLSISACATPGSLLNEDSQSTATVSCEAPPAIASAFCCKTCHRGRCTHIHHAVTQRRPHNMMSIFAKSNNRRTVQHAADILRLLRLGSLVPSSGLQVQQIPSISQARAHHSTDIKHTHYYLRCTFWFELCLR